MKILLAIDGSKYGGATVKEVIQRTWPSGTEVRVVSVAHPSRFVTDPIFILTAAHMETLQEERKRASRDVEKVAQEITTSVPSLTVTTQVLEGSPKEMVVDKAMGSQLNYGRLARTWTCRAVPSRISRIGCGPSCSLFGRNRARIVQPNSAGTGNSRR